MILICYDGSADARAALREAARLLAGQTATVLTVWQPFVQLLAHSSAGLGPMAGLTELDEIDAATRQEAERRAAEGAELARAEGLDAVPRIREQESTTAAAILGEARSLGASAIVLGSRGLTGLKSVLLGSVSHAVLQHADRVVIVAPSPEVARARHQKQAETAEAG